ncbi:MAG TPA: DUF58 domain-containing protein [Polyangiaceae bacterium]|nr:DUF58 domain-containing protein [Polyangiaceae bacterium]
MKSALLDPDFVRELEVLRRRLEIRARAGGAGEHTAKKRGGSAEFQEHRPYAPGDDLRRIDWAAYARTGEPVLKIFRSEEEVVARVVCDGSASMRFGDPPKIDVARRISAAIGYLALAKSERAQLVVAGEGLITHNLPQRGRSGLPGYLRQVDAIDAEGGTDLAKAIDAVLRRAPRPGLLAIVSDFLDGGDVLAAMGRAAMAGHDLVLVHVVAMDELDPKFDGDFALEDAETGAIVEVTMDASALEAYALRLMGLSEELRAFAKKHRASYVRVRTDEPLEPVIRRIVSREVD